MTIELQCESCEKGELIESSKWHRYKGQKLKPITGNILFRFPQEWPAAYQICEGDGHFVWLLDPAGDAVSVNKHKLLNVLKKLFDEENVKR